MSVVSAVSAQVTVRDLKRVLNFRPVQVLILHSQCLTSEDLVPNEFVLSSYNCIRFKIVSLVNLNRMMEPGTC